MRASICNNYSYSTSLMTTLFLKSTYLNEWSTKCYNKTDGKVVNGEYKWTIEWIKKEKYTNIEKYQYQQKYQQVMIMILEF